MYKHDPTIHNFSAAREILPNVLKLKKINSILDVGCGTGTWLSVALELGVKEIAGVDGAALDQTELKIPVGSFKNIDLTRALNLNRKFDLAICLEVAEHLPESASKVLIGTLTDHSDFILFSAAIPGQGGQNHINEQWPDYWQELFATKGYFPCDILRKAFWNNENVEWWYKQNILIYGTKEVLDARNLPVSENIDRIIHPELLAEKINVIDDLNKFIHKEIWHPGLKRSFKNLVKAIIG